MRDAVRSAVIDADVLVMSAAVADYRPAEAAAQKLKKGGAQERADENGFSLRLVGNPDILEELAESVDKQSGDERPEQRLVRVGFAAETNNLANYAHAKLVAKRLNLVVANDGSPIVSGFGESPTRYEYFHRGG